MLCYISCVHCTELLQVPLPRNYMAILKPSAFTFCCSPLIITLVLLRHVRITESEPYCHSILFVCLSVGHSVTYSLPRLIDHNQIWSAGIYLSSDPCKPFWIPCLPYFGCQRENMQNFAYFQCVFLPLRT